MVPKTSSKVFHEWVPLQTVFIVTSSIRIFVKNIVFTLYLNRFLTFFYTSFSCLFKLPKLRRMQKKALKAFDEQITTIINHNCIPCVRLQFGWRHIQILSEPLLKSQLLTFRKIARLGQIFFALRLIWKGILAFKCYKILCQENANEPTRSLWIFFVLHCQ